MLRTRSEALDSIRAAWDHIGNRLWLLQAQLQLAKAELFLHIRSFNPKLRFHPRPRTANALS